MYSQMELLLFALFAGLAQTASGDQEKVRECVCFVRV
jgi:hypothetical protein